MKKYADLGSLLTDYRSTFGMTQLDLASKLEVDTRTVARWERNVTLIQPDKEKQIVEVLSIPHQVLHNLNTERPIAVFYDIKRRMYSHSILGSLIRDANWFKSEIEVEDERIYHIDEDSDLNFVQRIKSLYTEDSILSDRVLKEAARRLPELNYMLNDQSGFHAGYMAVIPLRLESYKRLRNREMEESEITEADMALTKGPEMVHYYYSLYADSLVNGLYIMARFFDYFREHRFDKYKVAGLVYREHTVDLWRQTGLKPIWKREEPYLEVMVEGDFDMFLFGSV